MLTHNSHLADLRLSPCRLEPSNSHISTPSHFPETDIAIVRFQGLPTTYFTPLVIDLYVLLSPKLVYIPQNWVKVIWEASLPFSSPFTARVSGLACMLAPYPVTSILVQGRCFFLGCHLKLRWNVKYQKCSVENELSTQIVKRYMVMLGYGQE